MLSLPGSADSTPSSAWRPHRPDWKHDVFISFRGKDTRKGFTSHLIKALMQEDIRCYRDVDRDERGQVVGPMLIKAIYCSRVAIVVFSTNYADSKWCLNELVEILACNKMYKDYGHVVIPIFYDIEPSEVRNQHGKFGAGLKRCRANDEKQKDAWRVALEEAGNISSWHLDNDARSDQNQLTLKFDKRDEAEFIENIVRDLSNRIFQFRSSYFTENAVGLDQNVDRLASLLNIRSNDVRVVGIYGMEGIGKTTIAKAICSRLNNEFEGISLLKDIQQADDEHKLVKLQKQLLQDILRIKQVMLSGRKNLNMGEIRTRLSQKKILLVLDNIEKKEHTYFFAGEYDFFSPGSHILITTRDEQLLDDLGVHYKFMVSGLNVQDSLQLFCHQAFAQAYPEGGYEELSKNLVHYAGGLPLAIETFASFLSGKGKDEWNRMLEKLVKAPCLDSLGVYLTSVSPIYPFKSVGPYGGSGEPFDDKTHTAVKTIIVRVQSVIHSISIEYDDDGSLVRSCPHGGLYCPKEAKVHMVVLDHPKEFFISVSGYIEENYGFRVIKSLRFLSNQRMYGPFGEETGTAFTIPAVDGGRIIGFFGNCDSTFVDSIGAYFGPIPQPYPFNSTPSLDGESETWDDGKHMDIRQIDVVLSSASEIESISILYDNYGHPLGPFTHGKDAGDTGDAGDAGDKTENIKIDYPYEYLTSISGWIDNISGKDLLQSITFHSNMRKYGPFGRETGRHFPVQWSSGKIVGFFGTVDDDSRLESIRAHLEPVSHIHPYRKAGPFGDKGGRQWDDGRHNSLRKIIITWGKFINSIQCVYENTDGTIVDGLRNGGLSTCGSSKERIIELDQRRGEYIHMMWGYYGKVGETSVIISLTFQSSIQEYGPFGGDEDVKTKHGTFFRTPYNIGMITGFYGSSQRTCLKAIGAHNSPVYHKLPLKTIGPFGYDGSWNNQWDDGIHSGIRKIILRFGHIIDSIRCVYDTNGNSVEGLNRGGDGGGPETIEFDYPREYLKSVSGHVGQLGTQVCIRSLTFGTNKRKKIGPFGSNDGRPFSFASNNGKIVGFFGRNSDLYLHSIGFHVESFSGGQSLQNGSI